MRCVALNLERVMVSAAGLLSFEAVMDTDAVAHGRSSVLNASVEDVEIVENAQNAKLEIDLNVVPDRDVCGFWPVVFVAAGAQPGGDPVAAHAGRSSKLSGGELALKNHVEPLSWHIHHTHTPYCRVDSDR